MTYVVDASVALKWVLAEDDSDKAIRLHGQNLIAPAYILVECANALRTNVIQKRIFAATAIDGLQKLRRVPLEFVSDGLLLEQGLQLALQLNHPIYDCLYLALALQRDAKLVTADQKFYDAAAGIYPTQMVRLKDL